MNHEYHSNDEISMTTKLSPTHGYNNGIKRNYGLIIGLSGSIVILILGLIALMVYYVKVKSRVLSEPMIELSDLN